ncbi:Lrp/AsnC family transcriptional regulator [Pseudonocardia kujensis]|uniref:Lrp/AsnC family transcriptional regulator n=1 Tax=Pseudonocardia kujensis TaxID=1128675 RepID=UPI001E400384|nr:Lrp/AsnC family transcriptional regulator [Pseudonocardia kujensis]MCE0767616.1 Lrp/AsnC family transcriptional regulator [Pseudonocardia kujensis]
MAADKLLSAIDARLLLELETDPRATVLALAQRLGLSRNTVQAHLARLDRLTGLGPLGGGLDPSHLGYPLRAFVSIEVVQQQLDAVAGHLAEIAEVMEVQGLSGRPDLLAHVVAQDTSDLYRVASAILAIPGVVRTDTAIVMREVVPRRLDPLLRCHLARAARIP